MLRQALNGPWQFRQAGDAHWLPASAPGGVHTDLLAAGRIPDPFVGDNELRVQWVAEQDWEYRRTFDVEAGLRAESQVHLVCDGLDTLAEVWLNGQPVAQADNMLRGYRWPVREWLRPEANELRLVFRSTVRYAAERDAVRHLPGPSDYKLPGGAYVRKAICHFGWDWGPRLPAMGIWRDIRLEAGSLARLDDVRLRQHHEGEHVTLSAGVTIEAWGAAPLQVRVQVTDPEGGLQEATAAIGGEPEANVSIPIPEPRLWWPNGYGPQPLYRVEVSLLSGEGVLDTRTFQVGLRTLELRQQPDEWGQSFTFVVNGVPIFARGANWIPADAFPTRVTRQRLEQLLGAAASAHHNMIRVWGGGFYEDEAFYDLCDRLGILVWQDFAFACAAYPLHDPAMLANLKTEIEQAVRRLRHRACLALWCGNNEMEQGWVTWGWDTAENQDLKTGYDDFFHRTLPAWTAAEDPDRAYWPSSPSSDTPFQDPNGGRTGDVHQWAVWHGIKPFTDFRKTVARFVSEFGLQSLPSLPTIAEYAEPAEWNMTSYVMEHHQRHRNGNGKIITYLTDHFRLPGDFGSLVYLTQILQAEAIRIGVEHWRRHPACSGTLYWQLDDCWPVASWSSLDYYGRWKALHYASRRFYAPALLSVEDEAERLDLCVSNDSAGPWQGEARWSLETLDGQALAAGAATVECAPGARLPVAALDFAGQVNDANRREVVLVSELWQAGECLQISVTPFAPTKHLKLADPHPEWRVEAAGEGQLAIHLQTRSLARFVELSLAGAEAVFGDNYFDLPAGRAVTVNCPLPPGWTVEQAASALQFRSVYETYHESNVSQPI